MRTKFERTDLGRNLFADKAHRKKQGDGVVSYVKPLLRSNAVLKQISQLNGGVMVSTLY